MSEMQTSAFVHGVGIQSEGQTLAGQSYDGLCFIEKTKHEYFSASLTSEGIVEMFARRKYLFSGELSLAS